MAAAGAGNGGSYLNALKKTIKEVANALPVSSGTRQQTAAATQIAAGEAQFLPNAGKAAGAPVQQAQGGQGRRKRRASKRRTIKKRHTRRRRH